MKPEARALYTLDDLLYLMVRLRKPETGCPWDIKQNFLSITPSTIEEAYEVVDAIERDDLEHLKEELGDLLFQVVFYSQLAREEQRWSFADVVHELTAKLLRRHPHVFPDGSLQSERKVGSELSEADVKGNWEVIKQSERNKKGKEKLLDDVPLALPALRRAEKLQKRAAKVGFDWETREGVLAKLTEEVVELQEACLNASPESDNIAEELGDVLFTCVNLARHCKLDSEQLLRTANQKFEKRFAIVEDCILQSGSTLEDASAEQMDEFWNKAKRLS